MALFSALLWGPTALQKGTSEGAIISLRPSTSGASDIRAGSRAVAIQFLQVCYCIFCLFLINFKNRTDVTIVADAGTESARIRIENRSGSYLSPWNI